MKYMYILINRILNGNINIYIYIVNIILMYNFF
jgi:hypothetical protein